MDIANTTEVKAAACRRLRDADIIRRTRPGKPPRQNRRALGKRLAQIVRHLRHTADKRTRMQPQIQRHCVVVRLMHVARQDHRALRHIVPAAFRR